MDISTDIFKISCANWERDINCSSQSASGGGHIMGGRRGVNPCPPKAIFIFVLQIHSNLQRYSENYTYNFGVTSSNHNIFDDFEFSFMYIIENIFFVWTSSV